MATAPPPETVLQIAISVSGLRALGIAADIVDSFSPEFIAGMNSDASRARRLGDVGANDSSRWQWGAADGPYYEKAMMMRSRENTIYFASVNYALRFQESATSLIAPSGECQAYLPYGQESVLVQEINLEEATGLLATRYEPERNKEFTAE